MSKLMTKDEFKEKVAEFLTLVNSSPKFESSWFLSLEDWAHRNFDIAYDKDYQSIK